MEFVLILIYEVWAIFSGYRVLSGRSEWLDRAAPFNAIIKFIICFIVGNFIGAFYLVILMVKIAMKIAG